MDFRPVDPTTFFAQPTPRPKKPPPPPPIPVTPAGQPASNSTSTASSSQQRLCAPRRSKWEKMHDILGHISKDLDGLGNFLELLFYHRPHGTKDVRTSRHKTMVTHFLQGRTNVKMGHIIELIYRHRQSQPPPTSAERELAFSSRIPHTDICHARPALSAWALILVGQEARREIGRLTQNDPTDPTDTTQLRASTNGRVQDAVVADWDTLADNMSISKIAAKYSKRGTVPWYLTEMMSASKKDGVIVVRQRRPHTTASIGAISSFILARNRYASGYLALPLAVWQFACKSHVDEKRIFSRFGLTVHDTTARACLDSLTDTGLEKMCQSIAEGIERGEMLWQYTLDNVQQFCRQRDLRLGRQDILKVGCAATAILLEDCAPGAFNLQDHLNRMVKQERKEMTTESLYLDIDWDYIHELTALHWVRILVEFLPQLAFLRKDVEEIFHSERMTKRRLPPDGKTVVQPLGTNAERETETQGMMRAMLDFEAQMGLDEKAMEGLIITPRGDGASIAAMWRIKKYLSAHPNHYKAFQNCVPPGPEIWHTRWTQLNSISANCYGAASAQDPFALSKSATAVGAKRPSDLKKVDFWPVSRSMALFFEARVLDCWRIFFGVEDLLTDFPTSNSPLPRIDTLLSNASTLVRRYASQDAYHQALDRDFYDSSSSEMRVPLGTPWTKPIAEQTLNLEPSSGDPGDGDEAADAAGHLGEYIEPGEQAPEIAKSDEEEVPKKRKKKSKSKKTIDHVEADDFSGDHTLANECLFLQDMGWWVIAAHAVPDGEVGQL
ncbi:hypothetical protein R3P38DRAFT_2525871 [Favolaschia claudopus]|uniref:DUF6589 domain-containing protein n=1 Tax=Favolaschia claudopus TaxID=2862362 RepID=A0AAW0BSY4_9AGAR